MNCTITTSRHGLQEGEVITLLPPARTRWQRFKDWVLRRKPPEPRVYWVTKVTSDTFQIGTE